MNLNLNHDMPRPNEQEKTSNINIASATVASEKHPDKNQDAYFHSQKENTAIAGIFDGVGGFVSGDEASITARRRILKRLQEMPADIRAEAAQAIMQDVLLEADTDVRLLAREKGSDMGTTASVLIICDSPNETNGQMVIGNIGDSRVYRLRDGKLEQLTLDDSSIRNTGDEAQAKALQDRLSRAKGPEDLNADDMVYFKTRNIINQALGGKSRLIPKIFQTDVRFLDRFFLASDGITDNLTLDEIQEVLNINPNPQHAMNILIEASVNRSKEGSFRSKSDDMTGIIIDIDKQESISHEAPLHAIKPAEESSSSEQILFGKKVIVMRSNGELDGDWVIVGPGVDGRIIVTKEVNNELLTKHIPINELKILNNTVKQKALINNVTTEQELFDVLTNLGGLQGSEKFYKSAELIALIKKVMTGEKSLGSLTREGDLRIRVADLMTMHQIRGKL